MINTIFFLLQTNYISTNFIQEQAIFPLPIIIVILGLGGMLYILFSGKSPTTIFKNEEEVNIAILGPNESGKTTLWNYLKGKPFSKKYEETEGKIKISFVTKNIIWTVENPDNAGNKIKCKGVDINGTEDFIRTEWEEIIKNANMIIFIFNAYNYLYEINYQRDVNQRMQFIKSTIEKHDNEKKRGIWLLGSHADLLTNKKKEWKKVIEIIKTKPYCEISNNNACIDLTNEKELKEYFHQMFKK